MAPASSYATIRRGRTPATRLPHWARIVREPLSPPEVAALPTGGVIRDAEDVVNLLRPRSNLEEIEVFWVLCLDAGRKVRQVTEVSRGTLTEVHAHPREVFRVAIACGAAGIIAAHNHPSGNPAPSELDKLLTSELVAAGNLLYVPLYDHIILAGARFTSLAREGLI